MVAFLATLVPVADAYAGESLPAVTPVPEPPVVAMLITAGLMGGAFYFRKKRQQLADERRRGQVSRTRPGAS